MNPSKKRSSQRAPAVAGKFYPENPVELQKKIACHLGNLSKKKQKAIGVVSPHAGFIYSGDIAGAVYSRIKIPETIILLWPQPYRSRRKYFGNDRRHMVYALGRYCY